MRLCRCLRRALRRGPSVWRWRGSAPHATPSIESIASAHPAGTARCSSASSMARERDRRERGMPCFYSAASASTAIGWGMRGSSSDWTRRPNIGGTKEGAGGRTTLCYDPTHACLHARTHARACLSIHSFSLSPIHSTHAHYMLCMALRGFRSLASVPVSRRCRSPDRTPPPWYPRRVS